MSSQQTYQQAVFDTGVRERVDERTTYHGSGWQTTDGEVKIHVSRDVSFVVGDRGQARVYHQGRRCL